MNTPLPNTTILIITQVVSNQRVGQYGTPKDSTKAHPEGSPQGNEIPPDKFPIDIQDCEYVLVC
jgi:hypothetical protein